MENVAIAGQTKTVCACPCGQPFIANYPGQRYIDRHHRYRAQNARIPVKRSKASAVTPPDGRSEPQEACYVAVTEGTPSQGAQPSEAPQILATGAILNSEAICILTSELLTTAQVAALFGVTKWTLNYWRVTKHGPPFLLISRGCIRYSRAALEAWLKAHVHTEGKRQPAWGRKVAGDKMSL